MYLAIAGWGVIPAQKNTQYNYSKKIFTGRSKLIRIIGYPYYQRPDICRPTVVSFSSVYSAIILFPPSVPNVTHVRLATDLNNSICATSVPGHPVVQFVKAPRYKPQGHGFDSRWCHRFSPLT